MWKIIQKLLVGIAVSCFFFPFEFIGLSGINTKMMLAILGIAAFGWNILKDKLHRVDSNIVISACYAFFFSFICFFSEVYLGTEDGSYTKYFTSFFVWLFAGYAVCHLIRMAHGTADLRLITYYLAAVGVFQCIIAQFIADYPAFQATVDSVIQQGQDFLHEVDRIYGIGAYLDNAGIRFSIMLILISYFIIDNGKEDGHTKELIFLYISYIVITVFGNMISRTTTVGAILGIAYLLIQITFNAKVNLPLSRVRSFVIISFILAAAIPVFIYLYNSDSDMQSSIRFAFEGFFNMAESGEFSTDSTDKLQDTMVKWPTDLQTWLIGTGHFGIFAFGTDVGYCRFILYCGLIGFGVFSLFFCHNALAISQKFPRTNLLALFLLALTFIIWIKVATDIFQIYALLFCADSIVRSDRKETNPTEQ